VLGVGGEAAEELVNRFARRFRNTYVSLIAKLAPEQQAILSIFAIRMRT